jgi:hypothetical protein
VVDPLLKARAHVLHDLSVCAAATNEAVALVEDILEQRRWWLDRWPAGSAYVAGLVAQDLQEALVDILGRWPSCPRHHQVPHVLRLRPDLGIEPQWICEQDAVVIAPLGEL